MKAFWYNDDRKNVCGIKIRELRKEKHIFHKKIRDYFLCVIRLHFCAIITNTIKITSF